MMNKSKIDWCDFSWNPVAGCYHGCEYCYARTASVYSGRKLDGQSQEEKAAYDTAARKWNRRSSDDL